MINLKELDFSNIGYTFSVVDNNLASYDYSNDIDEDSWFELIPDSENENLVILAVYMRASLVKVTAIDMNQIEDSNQLTLTVIRIIKKEEPKWMK